MFSPVQGFVKDKVFDESRQNLHLKHSIKETSRVKHRVARLCSRKWLKVPMFHQSANESFCS